MKSNTNWPPRGLVAIYANAENANRPPKGPVLDFRPAYQQKTGPTGGRWSLTVQKGPTGPQKGRLCLPTCTCAMEQRGAGLPAPEGILTVQKSQFVTIVTFLWWNPINRKKLVRIFAKNKPLKMSHNEQDRGATDLGHQPHTSSFDASPIRSDPDAARSAFTRLNPKQTTSDMTVSPCLFCC